SMADTIVVDGAEDVSLCGGLTIPIRVPDPEGKIPKETTQELVALYGAHTLGSKGFGNPVVFDNAYYKVLLEKPWQSLAEMTTMVGIPSDHALIEDDKCLRSDSQSSASTTEVLWLEEKLDQPEEEHVRLEAALKKEFEDQRNENRREWQEKFKELQSWKITTPLPT
ncbi:putative L-ascorbate peroxidase 6, partial [Tanacetum coccineum]